MKKKIPHKKIRYGILAILLIFSLTACNKEDEKIKKFTTAAKESKEETKVTEKETVKPNFTSDLFDLAYSEAWKVPENGEKKDDSYADILIEKKDGDTVETSVKITADITSPEDYRNGLKAIGIDAYEMVTNHSEEMTKLGGVEFVSGIKEYWGEETKVYLARIENAKETIEIQIVGEEKNQELVQEVLDSLAFHIKDKGNVDPPWPWDGEPFKKETPFTSMVGTYTITSAQIPISESIVVDDIFSGRIGVAGDKGYIFVDEILKYYTYDGNSLQFQNDIGNSDEFSSYDELDITKDGTLYVSGLNQDLLAVKDGAMFGKFEEFDSVAVKPDGSVGYDYFMNESGKKISFADGLVSSQEVAYPEFKAVSKLACGNNYLMAFGNSIENDEQKAMLYDYNHVFQMQLSTPETIGSVTDMIETENGFIALDGNMREILFWDKAGNYIGSLEDSDIFGTGYPWISDAVRLADGSILIALTEEREDESADELVVFKLTGF